MKKENKSELIHIRIEPETKEKAEVIFKKLGINTSYAVSMFLNQVILREGFPFEIELPKTNNSEYTNLAMIIESTAGNGTINEKNKKILNLYADGYIDYETAVFAIKRSFVE
jgi:DNA-damage-inducible protein J